MTDQIAHPLVEAGPLISPLLAAVMGAALVLLVGRRTSLTAKTSAAPTSPPETLPDGLDPARVATLTFSAALLAVAIVAGWFGDENQLRNITPALVIGVGWPLLLASSLVGLRIWPWVNPFDALARPLGQMGAPDDDFVKEGHTVLPAIPAAAGLVWYLHVFSATLEPRNVATALAIYTVLTVAGCLAVGRRRWMSRGEVFSLLFGWLSKGVGLARWDPPAGTAVLVSVLVGGLLATPLRRRLLALPATDAVALRETLVLAALVAGVYLLTIIARRWDAARPALVTGLVPAIAGIAIADALQFSRIVTSAQLIVRQASDPLGRGWDLFGTAGWSLQPWFLDDHIRALLQAVIVAGSFLLGAVTVGRRFAGQRAAGRDASLALLCIPLAVALSAFLST